MGDRAAAADGNSNDCLARGGLVRAGLDGGTSGKIAEDRSNIGDSPVVEG
jgi:hypothetical protein